MLQSFEDWKALQKSLLELEQSESVLTHETVKIEKLRLYSVNVSAFGKITLRLGRDNPFKATLNNGIPIKIVSSLFNEGETTGIVKRCFESEIEVICKNQGGRIEPNGEYNISLETIPDETTNKRINKALDNATNTRWVNLLFGSTLPRFSEIKEELALEDLNTSQTEAVSLVDSALDIAVIHGPPGTGKTTTLIKTIEHILKKKPQAKILCCAPSNVAVDNMLALLSKSKDIKLLRLGHPSRVNERVLDFTLDYILQHSDVAELVKDAKQELLETRDFKRKKELRQEIKFRERNFVKELITNGQVVLSTIASSQELRKLCPDGFYFTHLIVDEAAQAIESSIWIPIQFLHPDNGVLILAGDHKQLPPTVKSDIAFKTGLGFTMMERIVTKHKGLSSIMLSTQYRMNELIMNWSSKEMYSNQLRAHDSVAKRQLGDLQKVLNEDDDMELFSPLLFIDTCGCGLLEEENGQEVNESRYNLGEVDLVIQQVQRLSQFGLSPQQIAVVTPYRRQVEEIKSVFLSRNIENVEVKTVDGFQGQEREAVILSMVRSNSKHSVGFLSDERRLNVAITRAKRHVCLIGDSNTLQSNGFIKNLLDYFHEHGVVRSASEFISSQDDYPRDTIQKMTEPRKPLPPPKKVEQKKKEPETKKKQAKLPIKTASQKAQTFHVQEEIASHQKFAALQNDEESGDDEIEPPSSVSIASSEQKPLKSTNKKKKKKQPQKEETLLLEENDDELDKFLELEALKANQCSFSSCSTNVSLLGNDCKFCRSRYCLTHRQPERHGCGDIARAKAFEGNSRKPPMKPSERAKVQQKLEGKIHEKEESRSVKKKELNKH